MLALIAPARRPTVTGANAGESVRIAGPPREKMIKQEVKVPQVPDPLEEICNRSRSAAEVAAARRDFQGMGAAGAGGQGGQKRETKNMGPLVVQALKHFDQFGLPDYPGPSAQTRGGGGPSGQGPSRGYDEYLPPTGRSMGSPLARAEQSGGSMVYRPGYIRKDRETAVRREAKSVYIHPNEMPPPSGASAWVPAGTVPVGNGRPEISYGDYGARVTGEPVMARHRATCPLKKFHYEMETGQCTCNPAPSDSHMLLTEPADASLLINYELPVEIYGAGANNKQMEQLMDAFERGERFFPVKQLQPPQSYSGRLNAVEAEWVPVESKKPRKRVPGAPAAPTGESPPRSTLPNEGGGYAGPINGNASLSYGKPSYPPTGLGSGLTGIAARAAILSGATPTPVSTSPSKKPNIPKDFPPKPPPRSKPVPEGARPRQPWDAEPDGTGGGAVTDKGVISGNYSPTVPTPTGPPPVSAGGPAAAGAPAGGSGPGAPAWFDHNGAPPPAQTGGGPGDIQQQQPTQPGAATWLGAPTSGDGGAAASSPPDASRWLNGGTVPEPGTQAEASAASVPAPIRSSRQQGWVGPVSSSATSAVSVGRGGGATSRSVGRKSRGGSLGEVSETNKGKGPTPSRTASRVNPWSL
uniref:Uncharacterized protein n=1 Tax=Chromera velia CCMP2878 TaxID=1169474 RepID=A0A0G4FG17_9ALVE|eukprot:Cvel_16769.t1-p1 / transcript=Cvel_16769.t1 / gene=Cvel_16769 / organism=Chromera_velia_CCMP2878 / gene_product=hypothetical protein / transcript_product=hypothetical protein / location=Cvel_scaffold1308:13074-14984(-) / protein_length=637 / sequence_SO=supercontig / SO=protein_coding / is_pseudo=false